MGKSHGIFDRAMAGNLAEIGSQEGGHVYLPLCHVSYSCGLFGKPELWLASCPSVIRRMSPPRCNSVTYLATESSRLSSPCLTACASNVVANTLPTEPRLKIESAVTWRFWALSAMP